MDAVITGIVNFVQDIIPNPYFAVLILSMTPMIEVKGAIMVGIGMGLNPWLTCIYSVLSSLIVCPFILFLLRPILNALKKLRPIKRLAESVEAVFIDKAARAEGGSVKKKNLKQMLVVFLFVAIPLPLTGVWTGSAVAVFLSKQYRYTVPPIIVGNIFEGVFFTLISFLGATAQSIVILTVGLFMVISLTALIASVLVKAHKQKRADPKPVGAASEGSK